MPLSVQACFQLSIQGARGSVNLVWHRCVSWSSIIFEHQSQLHAGVWVTDRDQEHCQPAVLAVHDGRRDQLPRTLEDREWELVVEVEDLLNHTKVSRSWVH